MIELFTAPTPNGWKISIMLEECGLPYEVRWVSIGKGDQFKPEFLAISPNNRIPAIVDYAPADGDDPVSIFETGAILVYLAEKVGQFLATNIRARKASFRRANRQARKLSYSGTVASWTPAPCTPRKFARSTTCRT